MTNNDSSQHQTEIVTIPHPHTAPFGVYITAAGLKEVWDAFVIPHQEADLPQSVEMRTLMGVLRAVHHGLEQKESKQNTTTEKDKS